MTVRSDLFPCLRHLSGSTCFNWLCGALAGKGALNYDELLAALKCELTERRYALVRKAFDMLDPSNNGM
jgi:hypothetical protein